MHACRRPRRLGGGLGGEGRLPKPPKKPKYGLPVHMLPEALSGVVVAPVDDRYAALRAAHALPALSAALLRALRAAYAYGCMAAGCRQAHF